MSMLHAKTIKILGLQKNPISSLLVKYLAFLPC